MGSCLSKRPKSILLEKSPQPIQKTKDKSITLIKSALAKVVLPFVNKTSREQVLFDSNSSKHSQRTKSSLDLQRISTCFKKTPIFSTLSDSHISQVSESMFLYTFRESESIIEENTPGHFFFIISSGKVEILKSTRRVGLLTEGDCFGELALIHNILRTSSVKALTTCELWGVSRDVFKAFVLKIANESHQENIEFIGSIPIFQMLTQQQREELVKSLIITKYPTRSKILKINEQGNTLYIIKEGTVTCVIGGNEVARLNKGEYFGEIALLNNAPRNSNIIAYNSVTCLLISKDVLINLFADSLKNLLYHNLICTKIEKHELLKILLPDQIQNFARSVRIKTAIDSVIAPKFSIISTKIILTLKGKFFYNGFDIEPFTFIGVEENIFSRQDAFVTDVECKGECDYAEISSEEFMNIIGGNFSKVLELQQRTNALKSIKEFENLSSEAILELAKSFETACFNARSLLLTSGQKPRIFIVKEGVVKCSQPETAIETKFISFAVKETICGLDYSKILTSHTDSVCWILDSEAINQIVPANYLLILRQKLLVSDKEIELSDINIMDSINSSNFIASSKTGGYLKVKTVSKHEITEPFSSYLKQDLRVHSTICHNLISQYVKTLKDHNQLYILTEYIEGPSLKEIGSTSQLEPLCKFYLACLLDIFNYLNHKGIILRSLEASHLIIDREGYMNLCNLSFAVFSKDKTYTVLGNPYYMSPEMISHKGYDCTASYWAAGVILFEIICGQVPFGAGESDPLKIYESILEKRIIYNKRADSVPETKKIIEQLLCKVPKSRIPGDIESFTQHQYFSNINWASLKNKTLKPPLIPSIKMLELKMFKSFNPQVDLNGSFDPDWDKDF